MIPIGAKPIRPRLADANKSWICFLLAMVIGGLIFRRNPWLEIASLFVSCAGVWFAVRAIRSHAYRPLGIAMLVFNTWIVGSVLSIWVSGLP